MKAKKIKGSKIKPKARKPTSNFAQNSLVSALENAGWSIIHFIHPGQEED